jgi:hypothetical protein
MAAAWMYRIGVPLPVSATSEEGNGQLVRHVTMGKNIHFDQIATTWEPGHRVLWTYRFTEDSFPPQALDDLQLVRAPDREFPGRQFRANCASVLRASSGIAALSSDGYRDDVDGSRTSLLVPEHLN